MSKLWTTSRKYKQGRRHTWWRGRNKLLVAYVPDGHGYSNTAMIVDDADRIWYMVADPLPRFGCTPYIDNFWEK